MFLKKSFFAQNAVEVAKALIGKTLVFGDFQGIITETEAYRGSDDPASHAYRGPTPRSQIMFGEPGFSYVYLIYGMYHCLNIVTEPVGSPSAVLIRGLQIGSLLLDGPGKLCRHLNLNLSHHQKDLTKAPSFCVVDGLNVKPKHILATSRIGIKQGLDKLWRFKC